MKSAVASPYAQLEQHLGVSVRAQRIDQHWSQVELAELANVSVGALKNLESGRGSTTSTLVRVVHALGHDDWLGALAPAATSFNPLDLLISAGPRRRSAVRETGPTSRVRRVRRTNCA